MGLANGKDQRLASGPGMTMSSQSDAKSSFLELVGQALAGGTFAGLTLGKVRGAPDLKSGSATLVSIKDKARVQLVTRYARRDETKIFAFDAFPAVLDALLGQTFNSATLLTANEDATIEYNRKGEARLNKRKSRRDVATPAQHDRQKEHLVSPDRPFLRALGVSDANGQVKPTMQGKFRQINRFIEILGGLIDEAAFAEAEPISVTDFGSGKGYLTFALYDFLKGARASATRVRGVEVRGDLVELCTRLAADLGFSDLSFVEAEARAVEPNSDIVIALHACDTATDDAMLKGLRSGARLIVTAPCCQHEVAPQLNAGHGDLDGILKYPLLKQRQADLLTDASRALLLEASGYKVKIIEFVSSEHTAKNILIAATKSTTVDRDRALRQYRQLKAAGGFVSHHLAAGLGFDGE